MRKIMISYLQTMYRLKQNFLFCLFPAVICLVLLFQCDLNGTSGSEAVPQGEYASLREVCVNTINNYRNTEGKGPYSRWAEAEACADEQAGYDSEKGSAHAGFRDNICEPRGWAQNECPGWSSNDIEGSLESCLKMMWDERLNPGGEQGHYNSMSSTRYVRVACGFYKTAEGKMWMLQDFE